MVLLDTSVLIDCLSGAKRSASSVRSALAAGERLRLSTLVIYEWLRGPRTAAEIADRESLFPSSAILIFGPEEAALSADIYRAVRRARSREIDIAIAATAIQHQATLWTLNEADFRDIPGLRLYHAKPSI